MNETTDGVRLAGSVLRRGCHACAFFHTKEEEYRLLLPFTKEGLGCGHKTFQIVDEQHRQERLQQLKKADIDVEGATSKGQLELRAWEEAYLRDGHFDQNSMLALIEEVLNSGKTDGFGLTRLWANMEWALEDRPGVEDIIEYESRLNHVLPKYDDVVVCTYDLNRFSATTVMDIMRTHPMVIIGGLLQDNPFYVPPDEFLQELKARRQSALA
jgi:hypothetical protein